MCIVLTDALKHAVVNSKMLCDACGRAYKIEARVQQHKIYVHRDAWEEINDSTTFARKWLWVFIRHLEVMSIFFIYEFAHNLFLMYNRFSHITHKDDDHIITFIACNNNYNPILNGELVITDA